MELSEINIFQKIIDEKYTSGTSLIVTKKHLLFGGVVEGSLGFGSGRG